MNGMDSDLLGVVSARMEFRSLSRRRPSLPRHQPKARRGEVAIERERLRDGVAIAWPH
jgi:hypothetical protein